MNKSVKLALSALLLELAVITQFIPLIQSVSNLLLKARGKINMQHRKKITLDITNTSQADQNKLIIN